jgi:DNA repair exonuclease SbcCD nuclease subunit
LERLAKSGIPTYLVCGNHDPYNYWINEARLPENVYCFNPATCEYKTFIKNGVPVADIHGMSFGESKVTRNLTELYELPKAPSPVSIALLHGSVGETGPHKTYAPFSVKDILNKGFDYWALGHIHKSCVIRNEKPVMVYPGNPQGRDFGETGRKGCYLVTISDGKDPSCEFIPTQVIRFESLLIDISGVQMAEELDSKLRNAYKTVDDYDEKTNMLLRITLTGRTALHKKLEEPAELEQLQGYFNEGQLSNNNFIWIDSINLQTSPEIDLDELKGNSGFPAEVLKAFDEYSGNDENLVKLFKSVEDELSNAQVKRFTPDMSTEEKRSLLERARTILIDHLTDGK